MWLHGVPTLRHLTLGRTPTCTGFKLPPTALPELKILHCPTDLASTVLADRRVEVYDGGDWPCSTTHTIEIFPTFKPALKELHLRLLWGDMNQTFELLRMYAPSLRLVTIRIPLSRFAVGEGWVS